MPDDQMPDDQMPDDPVLDEIAEWTAAQRRVTELMAQVDEAQAARHVPACPDWTTRDLLSHMVGLGADVLAGDEPDDHNDAWTARQVAQRTGATVAQLLDEWAGLVEPMRAWMRHNTTRPLFDVVIHEQDLRGALGRSGAQDVPAVSLLLERFSGRFAAGVEALPPIALVGSSWTWVSSGSAADAPVVVEAADFELARALLARRSAAQLRGWTTRGDVTPYLDAFATLGPLPAGDLTE